MGREARCMASWQGESAEVKALLDDPKGLAVPVCLRNLLDPRGERLHVVYHHNATSDNWHVAFDSGVAPNGCPPRGDASVLPSVEDPAGPTYEMIPPLRFHEGAPGAGLVLAGGNFEVDIGSSGPGAVRRIPRCHAVLVLRLRNHENQRLRWRVSSRLTNMSMEGVTINVRIVAKASP